MPQLSGHLPRLVVLTALVLGFFAAIAPLPTETRAAQPFVLRGTLDCGPCDATVPIWTGDLGPESIRALVDFSWLLKELWRLDLGDYIEVEVEERDGRLVALTILQLGDEDGTQNSGTGRPEQPKHPNFDDPATPTPTATQTLAIPIITSIPTATDTSTPTSTATLTSTAIATSTPSATSTASPTSTATATRTASPTSTATGSPTLSSTPTGTATATITSTATSTPTLTSTPTSTSTPASTPTLTSTPTQTSTPTPTSTLTPTPTRVADLSLTKAFDDIGCGSGICTATWLITVTNGGPDTATGVSVNDVAVSGLISGGTPSQGSISFSGDSLTWTLGTLSNGSSATLNLVTNEGGLFPLSVENLAQIQASDQFDPDSTPGNGVKNPCSPTQTLTQEDDYQNVCQQTD